jgi:hypothetical protein
MQLALCIITASFPAISYFPLGNQEQLLSFWTEKHKRLYETLVFWIVAT